MKSMAASSEMDDIALWGLLIKGDQKALEILYQRYYSLLLNYGLRCSTDKELVKDCIQDLFISLYQNTHINVTNITVRSYLLKALRNNLTYKLATNKEADSMKIYLNSYFLRMIMICNWPVVFWWQSHSYLRIKKQFFIYVTCRNSHIRK